MSYLFKMFIFTILFAYNYFGSIVFGEIHVEHAEYGSFYLREFRDVTENIVNQCHNKAKCDFKVTNSIANGDPCIGVPKTMRLTLSCRSKNGNHNIFNSEIKSIEILELTHLSIECVGDNLIVEEIRSSPYHYNKHCILVGTAISTCIGFARANVTNPYVDATLYGVIGANISALISNFIIYKYESYFGKI